VASAKDMSALLAEVFRRGGMKRAVKRANAVLLWPQVVGLEVAKFTNAKVLRDGVLYVDVSDSETSMHLMMQRQKFIDVYRAKYKLKELRDINFVVGRIKELEIPQKEPEPVIDNRELANIAKDLAKLNLPDDLAKPAIETAKRILANKARQEAKGWKECLVCEVLTDSTGLCTVCQRYAESVRVQREANKLTMQVSLQTPALTAEERLVAIYLATNKLQERMQELLPLVLLDSKYRLELEQTSRRYLAHKLSKPIEDISDIDFDSLDHRITRALGRWK